MQNILILLDGFKEKGIHFVSLQDNISTEGASGKLITNVLGAFVLFERDLLWKGHRKEEE